jgi:hypothetical protein
MRTALVIATFACLLPSLALAEVECHAPMDNWQPVAALRAEVAKLGLTVIKIRADDGCYHVKATDKDVKPVEAVFDPQTLQLLASSNADHETGEHDEKPQN